MILLRVQGCSFLLLVHSYKTNFSSSLKASMVFYKYGQKQTNQTKNNKANSELQHEKFILSLFVLKNVWICAVHFLHQSFPDGFFKIPYTSTCWFTFLFLYHSSKANNVSDAISECCLIHMTAIKVFWSTSSSCEVLKQIRI